MLPSDPAFMPAVLTLETARLFIRIDTEETYMQKFRTSDDAELKAYFGFPTDEALQKQKDKVSGGFSTYRTSVVFFHLAERSCDQVIGNFAFHNWYPAHSRSEIGYAMLSPSFMNQGYMLEAIAPIIAFGFSEMKLNRMEAFIHPDNTASRRLVERAGFLQEGYLREHYCDAGSTSDSVVYGLLRKEYAAAV